MRCIHRNVVRAATAAILVTAGCSDDKSNTTAPLPAEVETLRNTLAPYTSLSLAKAAGYAPITDCMSNGDVGAMGVHYARTSLFDGVVDASQPEVVIYEPGPDGSMSLVGVEFVVPFAVVPKTATPPTLFGQSFVPDNVFGLWTLHVWTHRLNPNGLFASWNPRVHCS